MKSRTPLQQAAFCALADLEDLYYECELSASSPEKMLTIKELFEALSNEGCDPSDYTEVYEEVCDKLDR